MSEALQALAKARAAERHIAQSRLRAAERRLGSARARLAELAARLSIGPRDGLFDPAREAQRQIHRRALLTARSEAEAQLVQAERGLVDCTEALAAAVRAQKAAEVLIARYDAARAERTRRRRESAATERNRTGDEER